MAPFVRREFPPPSLVAALDEWRLVGPRGWRRARPFVRRLARDLPRWDSVWLDALVQARVLTPFQAREIDAGRGAQLVVGPYTILNRVDALGTDDFFVARAADRRGRIWLAVREVESSAVATTKAARLQALTSTPPGDTAELLGWPHEAGAAGPRVWAAYPMLNGRHLPTVLARYGRCTPDAVREILSQWAHGLVVAQQAGLPIPGAEPDAAWLLPAGRLATSRGGWRASGTAGATGDPVRALGLLGWHLLTGRPLAGAGAERGVSGFGPLVGPDVQRLAPETPAELAMLLAECLNVSPTDRPSLAQVAERLGRSTVAGRAALAGLVRAPRPRLGARLARVVANSNPAPAVGSWVGWVVAAILALSVGLPWEQWFPSTRGWVAARVGALDHASRPASAPESSTAVAASPLPDDRSSSPEPARLSTPASPVSAVAATAAVGPTLTESNENEWPLSGTVRELPEERLRPGLTLRSVPGTRARLEIPPAGWTIAVEDLRFVDLDFVGPSGVVAGEPPAALLTVAADAATFLGCTFQGAPPSADGEPRADAVAVRWVDPRELVERRVLPTGELRFERCVWRHVSAGVWAARAGAQVIDFREGLFLGPGRLLVRQGCPAVDEPAYFAWQRVTLREADALLEVHCPRLAEAPGELALKLVDCAVDLGGGGAVFNLVGASSPGPLWRAARAVVERSLIAGEGPFVRWTRDDGQTQAAPDEATGLAGLARGSIEFAGPPSAGVQGARVVGPTEGDTDAPSPGIDVARLPPAP